jgi:hypothetical protein
MAYESIHRSPVRASEQRSSPAAPRPFDVTARAGSRPYGHHFSRISVHAPSESAVQLKKFGNDQEATDWLISAVNQALAPQKLVTAANFTKDKLETYLGKMAGNVDKYGVLSTLLTTYGGEYNDQEH